jgi:phosphoenolpyruvate carboxylase
VDTILRPLKQFDATYASRTPPQIGDGWKYQVIGTVSEKYSVAVEELIATVKRTEEALKSRKTRKIMAGGMTDGQKVKLQLFLDHKEFKSHVEELGVDAEGVEGLMKLFELTKEAESLFEQTRS